MALGTVGKYERLDVLGHGASGIVYLARDTLLRRQVAIKEISAQGEERERFLEEARVLDRLRHPNIVEVHNVDTIGGKIVIDMEYVEGDNLLEILRDSNGPLPIEQAVSIAAQICDGLAYAQERHIVHRDIKPANILVSRSGQVKLVDFGLAQVLGTNSFVGGAGTYAYMAPEDFGEYEASDAQSDLWAVGVILYEMLTGRRPFSVARPKDPFAWKRAIETEPISPPCVLRPEIPRDVSDICLAALARDRAQRYASASGMSADLREAQTSDLLYPQPVIAARKLEERGRQIPPADEQYTDIAHSDTSAPPMLLGASDIDGFLAAAPEPNHWDAARSALVTGRLSRWLEALGEKPLASVAMDAEHEARQESTGDAERDLLLRDFLYRAGLDTAVEARRAASAGSSFLKAGALEDAVAWLTQAVRLDSSHASYFLQLHKAYAAAGDAASATGVLERGLAAHPKDRTLRREAARMHQEIPRVTPTSVDLGVLRHGEEARASFVVQAAASESGVLQGRIASLPVWLAASPMTFTTRRRQRIDLTASTTDLWEQERGYSGTIEIETSAGALSVAAEVRVKPRRRSFAEVAAWYVPLLALALGPLLGGEVATIRHPHDQMLLPYYAPGMLGSGLLLFAFGKVCAAASAGRIERWAVYAGALFAPLGAYLAWEKGTVQIVPSLVDCALPLGLLLLVQGAAMLRAPKTWGRWQLWAGIVATVAFVVTLALWRQSERPLVYF